MVRNSEIFKSEGIQVTNYYVNTVNNEDLDEWSEYISKDIKETSQNLSNNLNTQSVENAETEKLDDTIDNDTYDEWCETTEQPYIHTYTLFKLEFTE